MDKKRIFVIAALAVAALLLAFPLQQAVQQVVVRPLAYLIWGLRIVYHSLPQFWIWVILLAVTFFVLLTPFLEDLPRLPQRAEKQPKKTGPVDELAATIRRSREGVYFKWVIANRLGKIARDWIVYRERVDKRWQANDLARFTPEAPPEVMRYLDAGLNGSFADYPRPRFPFMKRRIKTPMDLEPNRVLDILENSMEAENGR